MSGLNHRIVAAGAAALATIVVGAPRSAAADPIGNCSTTVGVIVVVDFSPWGGKIERGCDIALTTGYAALHVAGFTTAGDDQDGPAFICRIDNEPSPSQDSCVNTPPASAYWSYWHADAGQTTWAYSDEGAMSYKPPPGSVDVWVFGATNVSGADGSPPFSPSQARHASGRSQSASSGRTGSAFRIVNVTSGPAQELPTSGSPLRFVAGAAVVVVLGGVAGLIAWRRRRLIRAS